MNSEKKRSIYINPNYRYLFIARSLSAMGDSITTIALAFAILERTGSAGDLGIILAFKTGAMIVSLLIGGVVSDVVSRKKVLITTEAVRVLTIGLTAFLFISNEGTLLIFCLLQLITGSAQGFYRPASTGILPTLMDKEDLQQAIASLNVTENITSICGTALAGILIASVGAGWALLIDASTFLVTVICIVLMKFPKEESKSNINILLDLRDGWKEFKNRKWLVLMVGQFSMFHLAIWAPLIVIGPEIAKNDFDGASTWSIFMGMIAIGNIIGNSFALKFKPKFPLLVVSILFIPQILPLVGLSIFNEVLTLAICFIISGVASGYMNTMWDTTMQSRIPLTILSRMSSYDWFASMIFLPVGYSLVGPLKKIASNEQILITGSLIFLILVIWQIRKVKNEDKSEYNKLILMEEM